MKTLKYLFCLLFAGISLSLAGCGSNDDDNNNGDVDTNVTVGWKEEANKLILTTKYDFGTGAAKISLIEVLTFTFNGETCSGATCDMTLPSIYPDAAIDVAFAELKKEYPSATKSGKTITWPIPKASWENMTKSQIREAFKNYAGSIG